MSTKEKANSGSTYEAAEQKTTSEKTPEQQKAEKKEQIDKELESFNEKAKSPEEIRQIGNERGRNFQKKLDTLEKKLGPLTDETRKAVYKGLVGDVLNQAHKDNERYDKLQEEKIKLEGGGESKESSESDGMIRMLEYKLGSKLPRDREDLFRNFDKYVPKDFEGFMTLGNKDNPSKKYSRESIRKQIERDVFGATLENVDQFLDRSYNEREAEVGKKRAFVYDERVADRRFADIQDASSEFSKGNFHDALAVVERELGDAIYQLEGLPEGSDEWQELNIKKQQLRNFANRLTAEVAPKKQVEVTVDDAISQLSNFSKDFNTSDSDTPEKYKKIVEGMKRGDLNSALECMEVSIAEIQERLSWRKDREYKNVENKSLEERFGKNYLSVANAELIRLRNIRDFLRKKIEGKSIRTPELPKKEETEANRNQGESRETKEQEYNRKIENNAHPKANKMKGDLALFFDSIKRNPVDISNWKGELDEILYRTLDIEYGEYNKASLAEEDKSVFSPLIKLREEMDSWNTFSQSRREDFEKRFLGYLKETFGMETKVPEIGKKCDPKTERSTKAIETTDKSLDKTIGKVFRPGFKINEELAAYHKEWLEQERQKFDKMLNDIKGKVSQEEFDRRYEEGSRRLVSYRLPATIRPAEVETYIYTGK